MATVNVYTQSLAAYKVIWDVHSTSKELHICNWEKKNNAKPNSNKRKKQ